MSQFKIEIGCRWSGELGCLKIPDPAYILNFEDIGEGCLCFCAHCGPKALAMYNLITNTLTKKGPKFVKQFEEELNKIETEIALEKN